MNKIGVIGAGTMGNGIAHVSALAGFDTVQGVQEGGSDVLWPVNVEPGPSKYLSVFVESRVDNVGAHVALIESGALVCLLRAPDTVVHDYRD